MAKAKVQEKQQEKAPNIYEGMFLLGSGFAADLEGAQKLVRGIVERHEGKIVVLKKWDERKLAYEIRGEKRGLYMLCYFNAPSAAITPITRDVELSDQLLRVIITTADHLNEEEMNAVEPQPIQPREERNPWDRPQSWEERPAPRRDRPARSGKGDEFEAANKD